MTTLLHVIASPNGASSRSTEVALELVGAYRERQPHAAIETVDVWDLDLPAFDAQMIAAKFAVLRSQQATDEQRAVWARAVALAQAFNRADLYVFSLPMWNFGVPYRLKHYIDVITLPGQNWSWTRGDGYASLLRDKRAVLVYSSANDFAPPPRMDAAADDFQKPFMRRWLRFIGIDVVDEIDVSPTLSDPDTLAAAICDGRAKARTIASAV